MNRPENGPDGAGGGGGGGGGGGPGTSGAGEAAAAAVPRQRPAGEMAVVAAARQPGAGAAVEAGVVAATAPQRESCCWAARRLAGPYSKPAPDSEWQRCRSKPVRSNLPPSA